MNCISQWERSRGIASQFPAHRSWPCVVIPLLDPVNISPLATWWSVKLLSAEDAGRTLQEEGASLSGPSVLSYLFLWNCGQEQRASQWIWTAWLYTAFYRALSAPQRTAACSPVLAESTSVNFLAIHWATATLSAPLVLGRPSSSLSLPWVLWHTQLQRCGYSLYLRLLHSLEFLTPISQHYITS